MHTNARIALIAILVGGCAQSHRPSPNAYISPPGAPHRPFSEVVRVGRMRYLSGQLGVDGSGKLSAVGGHGETRHALENIKRVREADDTETLAAARAAAGTGPC